MAILQSLFGSCRSQDVQSCCSCREDEEVLTTAWIESLERVSVLGEKGAARPEPHQVVDLGPAVRLDGPGAPRESRGGQGSGRGAEPPPIPTCNGLATLQVPPEFDGARHGMLRAAPLGEDPPAQLSPAELRRCLQACLRSFNRALLRGISLSVLQDDGRTRMTEARLDSELTHLVLQIPHVQHPVPLKCIESVCTPDEAWAQSSCSDVPNQAFLDDRCATLIIRGGQFLTCVFDSPRTCEYFEMCLKVLILARESAEPANCAGAAADVPGKPQARLGDAGSPPYAETAAAAAAEHRALAGGRALPAMRLGVEMGPIAEDSPTNSEVEQAPARN